MSYRNIYQFVQEILRCGLPNQELHMLECSRSPGSEDEDCDANCSSWVEEPYFLEFGSNN
jgi:hypothetical protein